MHRFIKTIITLVCLIGFSAQADEPVPQTLEELKTAIEKIRQDTNTPAIGIALVNKDGPYWIAGLGEANIETHTKADENTLFRIGSVSKMFAALAVLKLQEEGKLSLDDKVRDLAPEIQFENPWEETHPIKVAHLLEHTTGWDDIHLAEYAYSAPDTMSTKEGLDYHPDSRKSRWIPGTRYAYCNAGAAVVAYIIEKITGKKYEDYIAETFFKPLDMQSTSYFETDIYKQKGATLYTNNKAEKYWHIIHRAAGSINSSPKDMANFVQLLLARGAVQNQQLIPSAAMDRMEVSATTLGSTAGLTAGYGLANYTSGYKDFHVAFRGHNGGVFGGLTELSYNKERETGYVFMINAGNWPAFDKISKTIRAYLLKDNAVTKPQPIALPEKFKTLNGYYAPINHRQHMTWFMNGIFGVMKFHTDEMHVYREPLLGGWDAPGVAYAINNDYLIEQWTGLPTIALVNDPIEGDTVQVGADIFKRVSAVSVFSLLGLYVSLGIISLLSLLAIIVWGTRRLVKKIPTDASVWIRI
ncbi:MAG TPA: serine hydrolase domain-containing protein, partial [Cellvibrio sp.]